MENIKTTQKQAISESMDVTGIDFASFIGVDLHKTTVTLRAVDPQENIIISLTINTKCVNKIEDWLNTLPKPRWMAVETVSFVEWFIDRYRETVLNRLTSLTLPNWPIEEANAGKTTEMIRSTSPSGLSR